MKPATVRVLLIFALVWFVLWQSGLFSSISLRSVQEMGLMFRIYAQKHYIISSFVFALLYASVIALSFPTASLLTMLAGYLFGFIPGTIIANIGATSGAVLLFTFVRYFSADEAAQKNNTRLETIRAAIAHDGIWYMLFARLVAIIPFFLVNIAAALSPISLFDFAWTTSIGIIPGSMVYAYAGRQLQDLTRLRDVFSVQILILFVLLALLALIPILFKRFWNAWRHDG